MAHRFSLGIDLGTSNRAIAFSEVESDQTQIVEITQVLGPNRIGEKPTLLEIGSSNSRCPLTLLLAFFPLESFAASGSLPASGLGPEARL
jgi:hypothetical protein